MKDEKIFFRTSNLNLATTLYTLGFPISGIYQSNVSESMEFYFEHAPELEKIVDQYWKRELKVEPNTLLINRKEILDHLMKQKNEKSPEKSS